MSDLKSRMKAIADDAMGMEQGDRQTVQEGIDRIEQLEGLRPYIEETWREHRDPRSEEYNECEKDECAWCEGTRRALAGEPR